MQHLRLHIVALAAVGVLAAGAGSALAATHSTRGTVRVAVARTALGRVLVDGRGHTLYLFEKDTRGRSACNGQCVGFWPPLLATGRPLAGAGAKASLLGTAKRADGRLQVTYDHHPLYAFVEDTRKGQTQGEGLDEFGAEWYAVSPAGATVEKPSAPSGQGSGGTSGGSGGGRYGY